MEYKFDSCNKWLVNEVLTMVYADDARRQTLVNALNRNASLTSEYELNWVTLTVYKEGFYLEFDGTRCSYKVFAKDNDGELELVRKPTNLRELYQVRTSTNGWVEWK